MLNIAVVFAEPGLPSHPRKMSSLVPRGALLPLAPPYGCHWAFTQPLHLNP